MQAATDIHSHWKKCKRNEYVALAIGAVLAQIGVFALYLNYRVILRLHKLYSVMLSA